jgi:bleomycin hydrolase
VTCTPVKDQSQSPTCWIFGTNSIFESDLMKRDNIKLNLSEMFIARYAYIDKAKQFLATKGKTYFEGGGQFHDVIRVISNYGMVPEEVYNGRPNEQFSHNHAGRYSHETIYLRIVNKGVTEFDPLLRANE